MDNSLIIAGIVIFLLAGVVVFQAVRMMRQAGALARAQLQAEQADKLETQLEQYRAELETARQAEKLALQKVEQAELARQDWEKQKQEFEQMARASVMSVGQELSSKLLADHKREAEEVKQNFQKEKQEENQKIREYLTQLNERFYKNEELTRENKKQNDILWRTFSSPSSTGRLAEVGLENLLKNMGLIAGSDYFMQYTVTSGEGAGLRPDCVVKLPNNRIVVIDCKASKHVLAIAEAAEGEEEEIQHQKFLATMREHLKTLARKDYLNAVQQEGFLSKREMSASQLMNVMYLPSSAAVELIWKLDPDLIDKSEKQGIVLIGPGMLHGLISLISKEISDERKLANQEKILQEVEKLLGALASTFGHISKVGSSIQTLTTNFGKISGSFNRLVAPKLRNLESLGIQTPGAAKMPQKLESYELRKLSETIDVEAGSADDVASIEDYRTRRETA